MSVGRRGGRRSISFWWWRMKGLGIWRWWSRWGRGIGGGDLIRIIRIIV